MDWSDNLEYEQAMTLAQETNVSFFLTGKAGTGKSQFIKELVANTPGKQFIMLAPTGIAAINIGGVTIHSFCRFPHRPLVPGDQDIKIFYDQKEKMQLINLVDTFIIDEVSMLRADIVEGIDTLLKKNTGNYHLPFGGKQIIFVGDLFQLSPVIKINSSEGKILKEFYDTPYFFSAPSLKDLDLPVIELTKSYRQQNPEFLRLLDNVRTGETTEKDLKKFNERLVTTAQEKVLRDIVTLTTTNNNADLINDKRLEDLKGKKYRYLADVQGDFSSSKFPAPEELTLKVGAQIMFLKNDAKKAFQEQRYFNGSIGTITELSSSTIYVTLENGNKINVELEEWNNIEYKLDPVTKKVTSKILGSFRQYPIKLAWAITIHKSQGLTFDKALIDLSSGTFSSGQAYVALSRVRSFEGLYLRSKINEKDIFIDPNVVQFSLKFNDQDEIVHSIEIGKEIYEFEKNGDLENAGLKLLNYSYSELMKDNLVSSMKFLKKGYSFVSCDCNFRTLLRKNKTELLNKFNQPEKALSRESYMLHAFIEILTALDPINAKRSFHRLELIDEEDKKSELYYYFKGRAYTEMNKKHKAFKSYLKGIKKYPRSTKLWYRLGRFKFEGLETDGRDELITSIIKNPSSSCVHRVLRENCEKFGGKLTYNVQNEFIDAFNRSSYEIESSIQGYFLNQHFKNIESKDALVDYIDILRNEQFYNSRPLSEKEIADFEYELLSREEDESEENEDFDYINFDEYEEEYLDNDYDEGPSYSRYGGAYGFDDDTIDSAFEGDPDNYWNID